MPDVKVLTDVADAITAEVRAAYEEPAFAGLIIDEIERSFGDWDDELKHPCTRIDVVPVAIESIELLSRTTDKYVVRTDLAVRKKFDQQERNQDGRLNMAVIDRLIFLLQQLHQRFRPNPHSTNLDRAAGRLPTMQNAVWKQTDPLFHFQRERLRQGGMFFGVFTFRHDVKVTIA
jgi:hypothetical protein